MRKRFIVSWMCFLGLCGCDLVYDYDPSQLYTVRKEACEMSVERATAAINVGVPGDRKVRYNGYFEYKLGRCSCRNELCQLGEVCNDYVTKDAASCVDYVCSDGVVVCSSTETGEGYLYRCEDNNWMQPVRCSSGCAEDGKSCIDNQVDECDEGERYCSEIDGKTALWTCEDGEYVSEVCHHGCDQANGCVRKNECKDDAQACVGEWIMECAQGGWLEPHQCAGGKCENDSCVFEEMEVCTVGGYRCNGVKLEQCNSSSGWETVNGGSVCYEKKSLSCVNKRLNEELCEYGCSNGKCMCKDEDRRCVNNHSEVCKNGKWDKESDCEYGCKNGKCNDCKDGTFKCDSQKKLWKCENGTWSGENFNDIEKHCKCPSENSGNENIVYESIYNICNNICVNESDNIGKLYNIDYPNGKECDLSTIGKQSQVVSCNQTLDDCGECKNGLFKCERSDGNGITLWKCKDGKGVELPANEGYKACNKCLAHNGWGSMVEVCGNTNPPPCEPGASKCIEGKPDKIDECKSVGWVQMDCTGGCEDQTASSGSNQEVIEGICLGKEHYTCEPTTAEGISLNQKYPISVMHLEPENGNMIKKDITFQERQKLVNDNKCLVCNQEKSKKVENVVSGIEVDKTICINNKNYKCKKKNNTNNTYELEITGGCQQADR